MTYRDPSDGSEYDIPEPMTDEELREEQRGAVHWLAEMRRVLRGEPDGPEAA